MPGSAPGGRITPALARSRVCMTARAAGSGRVRPMMSRIPHPGTTAAHPTNARSSRRGDMQRKATALRSLHHAGGEAL
jgi:hypothetical protein